MNYNPHCKNACINKMLSGVLLACIKHRNSVCRRERGVDYIKLTSDFVGITRYNIRLRVGEVCLAIGTPRNKTCYKDR